MIKKDLSTHITKVSALLQAISPEPRLRILLAIGHGEACVCHLEAILGYRQAYISQHLMALREAGLLSTRREGKFVFYRLERSEILKFVEWAGILVGFHPSAVTTRAHTQQETCDCPACSAIYVSQIQGKKMADCTELKKKTPDKKLVIPNDHSLLCNQIKTVSSQN